MSWLTDWTDTIRKKFRPRSGDAERPGRVLVISQDEITDVFGWTVDQVQSALEFLGSGNLYDGEQLLLAMTRDPEFASALGTREEGMVSCPAWLEVLEQLPERYVAALAAHWRRIWSSTTAATTTKYRVTMGAAPACVTWELDASGEIWLPRVHARQAGWMTWNSQRERYDFQGRMEVYPVIDDGREWVLFKSRSGPIPHQEGALRALAAFWWYKHSIIRYWHSQGKTHGSAIRKLKVPGKQRETDDVKKLTAAAQKLMGGSVVVCPQYPDGINFDFELLETNAANWMTFPAFIKMVDSYIRMMLLGADDYTKSADGSGSRAKSEVRERVGLRYLAADARVAADGLGTVMQQWCRYNRLPVEWAPQILFDWHPPEDETAKAKAQQQRALALQETANGLEKLDKLKVAFDPAYVLAQCGISLLPQKQTPIDLPKRRILLAA